jgi:hypothetical protein
VRAKRGYQCAHFDSLSNHVTLIALAAPAIMVAPTSNHTASVCAPGEQCVIRGADPITDPTLAVPTGSEQCPESGAASACGTAISPVVAANGTLATPDGQAACAAVDGKPVPSTPATCSNAVLDQAATGASGASGQTVLPSVPLTSLGTRGPDRLVLSADNSVLRPGGRAVLTATASSSVAGTGLVIEIFDHTSQQLVAACAQGSQCSVSYVAAAGGAHDFVAFATPATSQIPGSDTALASNHVAVGWLDSGITASRTLVGPGQAVTLTATSTMDVRSTGRWLEIYDLTTNTRLTYCSRGSVCATTMKTATGGVHEIVGYVNGKPEAVSPPVYVTWLAVSLSATSIGPATGGTVSLKAVTNADLTNTPWVVGIYDEKGRLVDHACKAGTTCAVKAWMSGGTTPTYTAVVGTLQQAPSKSSAPPTFNGLTDVQAKSASIQPTHLLWGVDSCKAITGDPTGEVFPSVVGSVGMPDFWGRYLTNTICPGISSAEVALAARNHMGILPIYNDYNCSNVSYYATGHTYAVEAVAAAQRIGIPRGRLLAIDIEPYGAACPGAGAVDSGFIEGWYDGVEQAGYVPAYYGNGTAGSEFAAAWCAAVRALPQIATGSDLWSFEPSLIGGYSKSSAPGYSPYDTGCPGNIMAWQYLLGSNGPNADVDQDEAISSLPLWYP